MGIVLLAMAISPRSQLLLSRVALLGLTSRDACPATQAWPRSIPVPLSTGMPPGMAVFTAPVAIRALMPWSRLVCSLTTTRPCNIKGRRRPSGLAAPATLPPEGPVMVMILPKNMVGPILVLLMPVPPATQWSLRTRHNGPTRTSGRRPGARGQPGRTDRTRTGGDSRRTEPLWIMRRSETTKMVIRGA